MPLSDSEIEELTRKTQKHHDNGDGFSYLGLPKSSRKDTARSIPCYCFECNNISEHQLVEINTKTNQIKVYCLLENHLIHTFSNSEGFFRWRNRR